MVVDYQSAYQEEYIDLSPASIPVNTKQLYNICAMLDQRRRRWADVAQRSYKCFVPAGVLLT